MHALQPYREARSPRNRKGHIDKAGQCISGFFFEIGVTARGWGDKFLSNATVNILSSTAIRTGTTTIKELYILSNFIH